MMERDEKRLAIGVAATINCLLILFLHRVTVLETDHIEISELRLHIEWIARPAQPPMSDVATGASTPAPAPAPAPAPRSMRRTILSTTTNANATSHHIVIADDRWYMPTIDNGLLSANEAMQRRLTTRPGPDAFAPKNHLPGVRVEDNSIGGKLQRMAKQRDCAELRGALRRQPESTYTILERMRLRDCKI